jgi:glycosyltransferase involved in cell wall biosynthesis
MSPAANRVRQCVVANGSVIYVTRFTPAAEGCGGNHRALQVAGDLAEVVGLSRRRVIEIPFGRVSVNSAVRHADGVRDQAVARVRQGRAWVRRIVENPVKLATHRGYSERPGFTVSGRFDGALIEEYAATLRENRPSICLIEHPSFGEILHYNQQIGIPTVSVFQNLESLDGMPPGLDLGRRRHAYEIGVDFANEIRLLAACDARLSISQVETGIITGVGLASRYYPYLPVGEHRENLQSVRKHRAASPSDPHLFLLLGSADHPTTKDSLEWFVRNARLSGLPPNSRVVAVGRGTEELRSCEIAACGVEALGWLPQPKLDELLSRARAMLVPQRRGLGVVTRVVDGACAGIPVIAFDHVRHAVDPPPGLVAVPTDDWQAMRAAMLSATHTEVPVSYSAYLHWEARQPKPLRSVLEAILAKRSHSRT